MNKDKEMEWLNLSVRRMRQLVLFFAFFGSELKGANIPNLSKLQPACARTGRFGAFSPPFLVWIAIVLGVLGTPLRVDAAGRIALWGRNDLGQSSVPAGVSNVIAIAAGYNHSLVIEEDGRVIAWGGDWEGITNVPPSLTNAVTIAAGSVHNLAVLKSGNVKIWGDLTHNQSSVPIDLTNAVDVAATMAGGYPYSVALRTDGTVTAWGQFQEMWRTNYLSGLTDVVAIGVGDGDGVILVLKSTGTIQGWDLSSYGPLSIPDGLSNVVEVALGWRHCLALRSDGTVVGWGDNSQGQITIPTDLTNVVAISAGVLFSVALKADGSVVAWGYNEDSRATVPAGLSNVVAISAGGNHCMAMSWDGPLKAWQTSPPDLITYSGQRVMLRCAAVGFPVPSFQWRLHGTNLPGATKPYLFVEQAKAADSPAYSVMVTNVAGDFVDLPILANVVDQPPFVVNSPVSLQTNITKTVIFSVEGAGSLPMAFQWFHNGVAIAGATSPSYVRSDVNLSHAGEYSVVLSNAFGVIESSPATLEVGQLIGWANSSSGNGGYFRSLPGDLMDLVAIEAGDRHSLAMTRSGFLIGLGDQYWDQSVIPTGEPYTNIVAVAETQGNVLALKNNGTVVIWGNKDATNVPAGLNGVVAIAAGRYHYLALRKDGTVVSWNYQVPYQVPQGLSNVVAISASEINSLALKRDGSVVGWGPTASQYPTPVMTNAVAIASGGTHGLALLQTGEVAAWGAAGNGATNVPQSLDQVAAITAGSHHSAVLRNDGTVVSWGNYYGTSTPVVPEGLTNVISISGGYENTLAMAGDTHLSFWKQPEATNTIIVGHTNVLFGAAVGMPPIHYQWRRDGTNIPGANSTFLFLEDLNLAGDVRRYELVASNAFGTTVSSQAEVRIVDSPPFITRQPLSVNTNFGRTVRFSVEADGTGPIGYQWAVNSIAIAGATNSTLVLTNIGFGQEGAYAATASNEFGTTSSGEASLVLGRVVAWGRNTAGETNPPASLTNAVAISAGTYHGLALRDDGSVVRWGSRTNIPPDLTNVVQIEAGNYNSIALRRDGTVVVWGDIGGGAYYTTFAAGLSNIVSVDAGDLHYMALDNNGRVIVWATQGVATNVPSSATNVVMIEATAGYCLALRNDGTVIGWGTGPTNIPPGLANVASITAHGAVAAVITRDGRVVAWTSSGILGLPDTLTNLTSIFATPSLGIGLRRDGSLVPWGSATFGLTSIPAGTSNYVAVTMDSDFSMGLVSTEPVKLWSLSALRTNLFSGEPIFLRAQAVGKPPITFQWQINGTNISGATNADFVIMNPFASHSGIYRVVVGNEYREVFSDVIVVSVMESAPFVLRQPLSIETNLFSTVRLNVGADGSKPLSYQWLSNGIPILGATGPAITISNLQVRQSGVYTVVLSNAFGVATSSAAAITVRPVVAWGLGGSAKTNIVPGLTNLAGIAARRDRNLALRRDSTIVEWGNSFAPITIGETFSNIVQVAQGYQNLALAADGRVLAWGQVTNIPADLGEIVAIAAGANFSAAVRSDGKIVVWGDNSVGQANVPPPVEDAVDIAAGDYHWLAIRKDGTIRGWGLNQSGQADSPANLSNIVAVAAGSSHSMALRDDGRVFVWGANYSGQTNVPSSLNNVIAIGASGERCIALRRDGTLVEWGGARFATPRIATNVVSVASGENHYLALVGQDSPFVRRIISPRAPVFSGETIRMSAEAVGQWPLRFQWRLNGVSIPDATNGFLRLSNLQLSDSGIYSVEVMNALGTITKEAPAIAVRESLPEIRVQPMARSTNIAGSVEFEIFSTGSQPLYYQWHHNGDPMPGANESRLQLKGLNLRQAGEYSVTVSNAFGVAISSNATLSVSPLVAWGCSDVCPPQVPIDGFDVVALAAGDGHALALRSNGTVVAWGKNDQGQADVPSGLSNVVAISACQGQSLALLSDGTVAGWGWRTNVPSDLRDVVAISAGEWHDLAITSNGAVVSWGFWNLPRGIVPPSATNALGGAASRYHSVIFRRDGSVMAWNPDSGLPMLVPPELQNVVAMASHLGGISALRSDGSLVLWGNGISSSAVSLVNGGFVSHAVGSAYGLGLMSSGAVTAWQILQPWDMPTGLQDVVTVAAGGYQGLALAGVGYPQVRVLPSGGSTAYSGEKLLLRVEAVGEFPLRYQWLLNGALIAGATNAAFFRTAPSEPGSAVYSVEVSNALGTTNVSVASFSIVDSLPLIVAQPNTVGGNVFSNAQFSVVADGSGPVAYQWYFEGEAISGATNSILSLTNLWPTQTGVYQVMVSNRFGIVVSQPAELRVTPVVAWGRNLDGQTDVPPSLHRVVGISASSTKVVALNAEGDLAKWGDKFSVGSRVPLSLTNIIHVASSSFNLALSDLGEVYEWDASPTSTNVSIVATGAIAVSAGYGHKVALKGDGTVLSWGGANNYGQTNVPMALSNVVAIAAGYDHSLALLANGTVRSWGNTNYGLHSVDAISGAMAVAAGGAHSLVLKSNGTVVGWGWNGYGQTNVPSGISNAVSIAAGTRHSMALSRDGIVTVWGDAQFGTLEVPQGLSNVVAISAGEQFCVALIESPSIHRRLLKSDFGPAGFYSTLAAFSGRSFILEATGSLSDTNWTVVANRLGQGGIATLSDTNAVIGQRFYRLRRE